MIGRWLALLTEQEEDNLLTTKLVPFYNTTGDAGCLVGVALKHEDWGGLNCRSERRSLWSWWQEPREFGCHTASIAQRFNELCQKLGGVRQRERGVAKRQFSFVGTLNSEAELLGGARAATLIRARILQHRAQRALAQQATPSQALVAV